MGSLKRRSLSGLVPFSPEEASNAGGTNQHPQGGQVSISDGPALAVAEDATPQFEFPASAPGAPAPDKITDPGVASEEFGRQTAPQGTDPLAPVPATAPRGTEPISFLPAATPSTRLPSPSPTTALRKPLVIHAKPRGLPPKALPISPRKRRVLVYATVVTLLVAILLGTLGSAVAAKDGNSGISHLVSPLVQLFGARNGDAMNVNSQSLTPTPTPVPTVATTSADDAALSPPSANTTTSAGSSSAVNGVYNPSRFSYGYCTYWAYIRYHELTGYDVPWLGNAYQWTAGAIDYGWTVSATPHVPSIIVLQPDVYQSGALGHVAIVESINADGSVVTSNMNWGAANWDVVTYVTFSPGPGVSFVWHP